MSAPAFTYILSCSDGTLYTGSTKDLERRVAAHNAGRGARYTMGRRPVTLVYSEVLSSWGEALRREYQIKRLSRNQKEALISDRFEDPSS
ncbi:MAG: GIY-YIG nuclease family protein [Planctomycetota bacterium]|jgi:putative endonuclease|nr:GIY-YIG nuclease family protein [Planctomycetota bacterium]